jgi:hypothetical protein
MGYNNIPAFRRGCFVLVNETEWSFCETKYSQTHPKGMSPSPPVGVCRKATALLTAEWVKKHPFCIRLKQQIFRKANAFNYWYVEAA